MVSLLFEPDTSVSSKRTSFWAFYLAQFYQVDIVTSSLSATNISPYQNIDSKVSISIVPKKTSAIYWVVKVFLCILKKLNKYGRQVIILSGGPFEIFLMSPFLRVLGFKIILDFRDPFADNLRFNDKWFKIFLKRVLQYFFILSSSSVVTVNESLALKLKSKKEVIIIPNGFAEYEQLNTGQLEPNTFYTNGQIYTETKELWESIKQVNPLAKFYYQGKTGSRSFQTSINDMFIIPAMPHKEMLEQASRFDVMILFGCNNKEISYTKIYDFIYLRKKIIIYNDSKEEDSELKILLKNYFATLFLYPNEIDMEKLRNFLQTDLKKNELKHKNFNRIVGAETLKRIIEP